MTAKITVQIAIMTAAIVFVITQCASSPGQEVGPAMPVTPISTGEWGQAIEQGLCDVYPNWVVCEFEGLRCVFTQTHHVWCERYKKEEKSR